MANKIFLDINILVDFVDSTRAEHQTAKDLFNLIDEGKIQAYLSESVINTTAYLVRKAIPVNVFTKLIVRLLEFVNVLPCNDLIIEHACRIVKNDFEDAVLYSIALSNKLNFFITDDTKDFNKIAQPAVRVVSASEMLKLV
jgi:predicted nucleic acid-binding protein